MSSFSRRQFLKHLGAASAFFLAGRAGAQTPVFGSADSAKPFEILVLGDSVASGHGLKEEQKFYTLTKNWLQAEVFQNTRPVNLKVKAHSGTTLALHADVAKALERAEIDETEALHPEINVDYPTAEKQIDIAAREYTAAEKEADLILLTGGINDITTTVILDPFGDDDKLRLDIEKYCHDSMLGLLRRTGTAFPNARIALIGYFPLVSPKTSSGRFLNAMMEVYDLPRPLKPIANNLLTKQFFKVFHKKSARRSRIWVEESNRRFREAVTEFNSGLEKPMAIFIESPIAAETCFGTKNPLVFGMGKKGRTEDLTYDERSVECRNVAPMLKNVPGLKYSVPFCQISGLAHPNVEGARAYAEAIQKALRPHLERVRQS